MDTHPPVKPASRLNKAVVVNYASDMTVRRVILIDAEGRAYVRKPLSPFELLQEQVCGQWPVVGEYRRFLFFFWRFVPLADCSE